MIPYRAILLDLDGTLTDSRDGILRCFAYALKRLDVPVPDSAVLHTWIGPPLRDTLVAHLGSQAQGERALALYRARFAEVGLFENQLYPGIPALLHDLHASGAKLVLATAKPLPYARRIIAHFGLRPYFALLAGATLDGTINTKAEVIASLLPELTPAERASCVMVGDRDHDVLGARAYGIPTIAVAYGFGSHAELAACQPDRIVASVDALRAVLLPEARADGV